MPARQKPTLIEFLIIAAILGILAAIVLPAMEQARSGAIPAQDRAAEGQTTAEAPGAFDGQLNTIEVSELSQSRETEGPARAVGVLVGLLPIIVPVAVLLIVFRRLRRQISGEA